MAAAAEEKPMLNTAAIQECGESAAGIFWPVFLTLIVVFAAILIVYFFWKYYWRIRHGKHLVLVTDVEKAEPEFAFDNPGFREGTPVIQAKKLSADIKEKAELKENGQKLTNGHKPQSLEDDALNKSGTNSEQKTNVIPLKSKDFTGLGFDICGNMRDGIYVKDLLHRGPASETGMIKQGDRISAIRINFSHMVYEDAKAILSYASPYEVEIEVEDSAILSNAGARSSSPNSTHSFYRSQSFSTAQQIQKIVPRKLNFNSMDKKPQTTSEDKPKPAILEVSEISDKMFKYGVKVLPDIKTKPLSEKSAALTSSEVQQHANCNSTVIDIQSDSGIDTKTPTMSFDEVDLSLPVSHHQEKEKPTSVSSAGSSLTSTFKDANVITKLGKGIQNIKEKLNNRIQKSGEKITSKETEMQKVDNKKVEEQAAPSSPKISTSSSTAENVDFKPQEDINLRLRSSSVSSNENDAKKSKRKAPLPPVSLPDVEFNLLNEIENEVNKNNNYECKDSDSEAEPDMNTIELNSSHITVHHIPEESSRKAASLGDLSKITEDSPVPLERAVSLELTEHTPRGSKKRKAPLPPEEDLTNEDLFPKDSKSDLGLSKLKKSSLFGTLEEAVKTQDDCSFSSDTNDMLTSSTPMKLPDEDNKFLSIESNCSNISWELNFDLQDDSKDNVFAEIDEKVPDLPTSPMPNPNLPTYVTEIKVSNGDDDDLSKVNISDLTLFVTAAEITQNGKPANDESSDDSKTLELVDSKTIITNDTNHSTTVNNTSSPVSSSENSTSTNEYENEDSKDDSSIDTVKEMTYTNGHSENHTPKEVSTEMKSNQKNFSKYSKENMSDEQILALTSPTNNTTPSLKKSKIKSPSSTNKVPKLSQSVSPVKAAGSRIPIRANTEPSLKVSLLNKDDIVVPKPRKYKLSEDGLENDKPVTFASSNHLPSPTHKTSVLSETRHNGPNR